MLPDNAAKQFASTFKEWHYFVGGAAITAVVAAYGYYRLARRLAARPAAGALKPSSAAGRNHRAWPTKTTCARSRFRRR